MWGLLLLFYAVVYFAVVGLLLYKVKPYWGKAIVLIAAVLIPNADDWYYRQQLADYCKNEAGFKVYQQVSRKEGLASEHFLYSENFTTVTPLAFIEKLEESANGTGKMTATYWRSDRLSDGTASKQYVIPQYTAAYEAKRTTTREEPFFRTNYQIVRRADQQVIAEFKTLAFDGGWYPRVLVGTGLVAACDAGGKVISRNEWRQQDNLEFHGDRHTLYKLINLAFTAN